MEKHGVGLVVRDLTGLQSEPFDCFSCLLTFQTKGRRKRLCYKTMWGIVSQTSFFQVTLHGSSLDVSIWTH